MMVSFTNDDLDHLYDFKKLINLPVPSLSCGIWNLVPWDRTQGPYAASAES